ncbi:MAG TPA: hypothetical protein VIQ24_18985 [Pyrinomonadaceae bacterium]
MNQRPAPNRCAARCLLLGLCFGLFVLAPLGERPSLVAAAQSPAASQAAQTVKLSLTVCVFDEAGRRTNVQPSLFNSPSNRPDSINQPDGEGCYKNPSITLKPGQVYFLTAVSEGRTAIEELTVAPDEKNKTVELKLAKKGGEQVAQVEICAKDEGGVALPVIEVKPAWEGGVLKRVDAADANCYRVASARSAEYKLALTTKGAQGPPPVSPAELRVVGSLLAVITLVGFALAVYLLLRLHWLTPLSARQEIIEKLDKAVSVLSELTPAIGTKVETLHNLVAALPEQMRTPVKGQTDGTGSTDAPVALTRHETISAATTQSPQVAATPRQNLISEDAQRKYKELSGGATVEHFYLMPSGASTASGMVEDTRIELVEQSKGTYVGFRSAVKEGEAMVFPMPNVHFSQETFKALFPHLTVQDYTSGNIEPRVAVNTQGKLWRVV